MEVLLTGISGNLGFEVALDLHKRGVKIVPVVRPGKKDLLETNLIRFPLVVESDLTRQEGFEIPESVDCILHCAGNIHFRNSGNTNESMMKSVTNSAKQAKIPIYFVSTAFVYRPSGMKVSFNNNYEQDKFQAEQVLISSGVPHAILRPSVLVGNSKTGKIQNFSGYYSIVKGFLTELDAARNKGRKLRFPNLPGRSDLVTVDQAANCIGEIVQKERLELYYITNPKPPQAYWVLEESLNFFKISSYVTLLAISFEEYGKLDLSPEERRLYDFCMHFNPYWTIDYNFPATVCSENLIDHKYLMKTLSYFAKSNLINNA